MSYQCKKCKKSFKREGNLKRHLDKVIPCKEAATNKAMPKKKLPTNENGKPICHVCGNSYANKYTLKSHIERMHQSKKRTTKKEKAALEAAAKAQAQAKAAEAEARAMAKAKILQQKAMMAQMVDSDDDPIDQANAELAKTVAQAVAQSVAQAQKMAKAEARKRNRQNKKTKIHDMSDDDSDLDSLLNSDSDSDSDLDSDMDMDDMNFDSFLNSDSDGESNIQTNNRQYNNDINVVAFTNGDLPDIVNEVLEKATEHSLATVNGRKSQWQKEGMVKRNGKWNVVIDKNRAAKQMFFRRKYREMAKVLDYENVSEFSKFIDDYILDVISRMRKDKIIEKMQGK